MFIYSWEVCGRTDTLVRVWVVETLSQHSKELGVLYISTFNTDTNIVLHLITFLPTCPQRFLQGFNTHRYIIYPCNHLIDSCGMSSWEEEDADVKEAISLQGKLSHYPLNLVSMENGLTFRRPRNICGPSQQTGVAAILLSDRSRWRLVLKWKITTGNTINCLWTSACDPKLIRKDVIQTLNAWLEPASEALVLYAQRLQNYGLLNQFSSSKRCK